MCSSYPCGKMERILEGSMVMDQEKITLLVNGTQAFPAIIQAIETAKTSVEINMFIWRDDEIGNRMAEAVLTAGDHGAKVSISVDRYGVVLEKCEEAKRSFFHKHQSWVENIKIRALEILYPETCRGNHVPDEETEWYRRVMSHPNIQVTEDVFKADHSKYYIIDDQILFLGGVNIEDKENGQDSRGRVYGDYMAKLEGSAYVRAFREKLATGQNTLEGVFFGVNLKTPVRRFEMEQRYLDLIHGARKELHITMAYFSPLKKFINAIVQAHERGVRVTVVIPEAANFQNDSNRRAVRKLLKKTGNGIQVYLSSKMLHTKLMMNETYLSFGSTNITKKAFAQLNELNLFVPNADSAFQKELRQSILEDIHGAHRVESFQEVTYRPLLAFLESFMV